MIDFTIIIPARYSSTRIKAKLTHAIAGKPLIRHTYENSIKSNAKKVIIATDDKRIVSIAEKFNAITCLTGKQHTSGSSRIAEAVKILNIADEEIIVNVQGDEPMIHHKVINQVAKNIANNNVEIATICVQVNNKQEYLNPNCVKVVFDKFGKALYFSRSPIPAFRDNADFDVNLCFKHIGIYAYKAGFIKKYTKLNNSSYEKVEKLEQLTALNEGFSIHVAPACDTTGISIDTLEDLQNIKKILEKK